MQVETDFLIIGGGIAGLSLALKVRRLGRVLVIAKKGGADTATNLAQGGIACVMGPDDAFELHEQDTLRAGDGLCHEDVVRLVVRQAPERIRELETLGVRFTRDPADPERFDLGMEGGHSRRRIVHQNDFTGRAIQEALLERAAEAPEIRFEPYRVAVDLVVESKVTGRRSGPRDRCLGAYVLDARTGEIHVVRAPVTVLCTGGAGKVYLYTSNPDVATGDGIAMAYRAGARVANPEFVQFHPTCLYHPKAKNFLISEALRGEGAVLLNHEGRAFMEAYDAERGELASRDVVARAIDLELKKSGKECVFLDISHRPADFIRERFPNIHAFCLRLGIDITREPIPVVPAAHYMSGGVVTDSHGETDIEGLFAVGETACTGLHGANRLASNSLLEGLVMAHQAALRLDRVFPGLRDRPAPVPPEWEAGDAVDLDEAVLVSYNWDVIRRLMWSYVGIVRSDRRLALARKRLAPILAEIDQHYWAYKLTSDFVELRNLAHVADLIVRAAGRRRESRGGHFNKDHPHRDDWGWRRDTILHRGDV
ncbi:L-aspartate oxidase [Dissulfurirhabdus thermomarina]|uniref:L-aspartate oxidase n=1 Tax=Dissulfurirhabdus thermomarina TaxID=1765737 RepID=A0A6N9TUM1_DISTH|nr:L-aspartate oxidase [Dissulfurirhabdus thermomarina]NDY43434.1 L-aspartate oxidase [Dissulfurirhabdus thermomarina]NMX23962.1 L-aspartate oxidase [Dissulfurirhabdus thermomarina]